MKDEHELLERENQKLSMLQKTQEELTANIVNAVEQYKSQTSGKVKGFEELADDYRT